MAQTFTFYSGFAKRSNSTKRPPSGTFSITYDSVLFKDNTSFRNPVIQLNVSLDNDMYVYKYCYHADSGRYYFINDWRWVRVFGSVRSHVIYLQHSRLIFHLI